MRVVNVLGHTFIYEAAAKARIAFDLGANHGDFSRWLTENTPANVFAFEPDPGLFRKLPELPNVVYVPEAVAGSTGSISLNIGEKRCSSAVYRERPGMDEVVVKATTLDDFCRNAGIDAIDLIKMDIEGAELSVIEAASDDLLSGVTQITVEFHDFLEAKDVPRIRAIVRRLRRLGFVGVRFTHFTWGDCLFINTARFKLRRLDLWKIVLIEKYCAGLKRLFNRLWRGALGKDKMRVA